jgi:hypothetical protein
MVEVKATDLLLKKEVITTEIPVFTRRDAASIVFIESHSKKHIDDFIQFNEQQTADDKLVFGAEEPFDFKPNYSFSGSVAIHLGWLANILNFLRLRNFTSVRIFMSDEKPMRIEANDGDRKIVFWIAPRIDA